jgi:hypothetical protein
VRESPELLARFGIEQYRHSNLSQREYAYTVALPAYLGKMEAAIGRSARTR